MKNIIYLILNLIEMIPQLWKTRNRRYWKVVIFSTNNKKVNKQAEKFIHKMAEIIEPRRVIEQQHS